MKLVLLFSILLASGILFIRCSEDKLDINNPDVDLFVKQMKDGTFHTDPEFEMPHFKKSDIPVLLEYAKDTSIVKSFPKNPISSFSVINPTLTQVLLWTVESIRIGGEFPSLSCQLYKQTTSERELIKSGEEILLARDLYQVWWKKADNPAMLSINYYEQSALKGSEYSWW